MVFSTWPGMLSCNWQIPELTTSRLLSGDIGGSLIYSLNCSRESWQAQSCIVCGRRPMSVSSVGSVAAKWQLRASRYMPRSRSANGAGTPWATLTSRYSSSDTTTRLISRPVNSEADGGQFRHGKRFGCGQWWRNCRRIALVSARIAASASAKSARVVQLTGPSSGARISPVSNPRPMSCNALSA